MNPLNTTCRATALFPLVILFSTVVALQLPETAPAIPGEPVGSPLTLQGVKGGPQPAIDDLGDRVVFPQPDGGYLAITNTEKVDNPKAKIPTVIQRTSLKIERFSSRGRRNKQFAKSEIAKGLRVGVKGEIWYFQGMSQISDDVTVVWGRNNGAIPFVGIKRTNPSMAAVAFSTSTGQIVRSFGSNGILRVGSPYPIPGATGALQPYALDATTGRIVTCGGFRSGPAHDARVQPLIMKADLASASPTGFAQDGSFVIPIVSERPGIVHRACWRILIEPSGAVAVAGIESTEIYGQSPTVWLARYRADGTADESFGNSGQLEFPDVAKTIAGGDLYPKRIISVPGGGLLIAGPVVGAGGRGFVARLTPTGQLDSGFGVGGIVRVPEFAVEDVAVDASGMTLVSGVDPKGHPALGRLLQNGAWDPNFYGKGRRTYKEAFSTHFFLLSLTGNKLQTWNWIPRLRGRSTAGKYIRRARKLANFNLETTLDSAISTVRRSKSGRISVSGFASSPTDIARVEIAVAPRGTTPRRWVSVSGKYRWSGAIKSFQKSRVLVVYSRVVAHDGTTESSFSSRDQNRVALAVR